MGNLKLWLLYLVTLRENKLSFFMSIVSKYILHIEIFIDVRSCLFPALFAAAYLAFPRLIVFILL